MLLKGVLTVLMRFSIAAATAEAAAGVAAASSAASMDKLLILDFTAVLRSVSSSMNSCTKARSPSLADMTYAIDRRVRKGFATGQCNGMPPDSEQSAQSGWDPCKEWYVYRRQRRGREVVASSRCARTLLEELRCPHAAGVDDNPGPGPE